MSKLSILKFYPKLPMVRATAGRDLFFQIIQKSFSSFLAFSSLSAREIFRLFSEWNFRNRKISFWGREARANYFARAIISQRSILTIFVTSYLKTVKNYRRQQILENSGFSVPQPAATLPMVELLDR